MEKGADGDDDRQLAELEATVNRLRALKSSWDTAEHLKTIEIPALELQLSELEQKKSTSADALDVVCLCCKTASSHGRLQIFGLTLYISLAVG